MQGEAGADQGEQTMTISNVAKAVGATTVLGGAGLLAAGSINIQATLGKPARYMSEGVDDAGDKAREINALFGNPVNNPDFSAARAAADRSDTGLSLWKSAAIGTAAAAGVGVIAGVAGLLTSGRAGSVARGIGIAGTAIAGAAALATWRGYSTHISEGQRVHDEVTKASAAFISAALAATPSSMERTAPATIVSAQEPTIVPAQEPTIVPAQEPTIVPAQEPERPEGPPEHAPAPAASTRPAPERTEPAEVEEEQRVS